MRRPAWGRTASRHLAETGSAVSEAWCEGRGACRSRELGFLQDGGCGQRALSLERKAGFGPETDFVELALQVCLAYRREPVVGDQLVSLADDLGDGGFAAGEAVQCPIPVRGVVQHGAGHEFIQGQLPVAAGDSSVVYGQAPAGVERVAVGHYGLAAQQGVESA